MMPLYTHPNFGNVQRFIFMKGIITSVDSELDTADVMVPGANNGSGIPLFYHCDPDSEERDNGAIEGAASAFVVDDEVIVMYDVEDNIPVRIIGFVDGIRKCGGYAIITSGEYCFVWDFRTNDLATDVFINNTDPREYVTEWPYHYLQTEHPDGPNLLSEWRASLESWYGWEPLFSESTPENTTVDNGTSESSFVDGGELTGYWFIETSSNTTDLTKTWFFGLDLIALNGSDEEINLYLKKTEVTTGNAASYKSCGNPNEGAPVGDSWSASSSSASATSVESETEYFTYSASGSSESSASASTGEDEGCISVGQAIALLAASRVTTSTPCPFVSASVDNASYYNADLGIILQMFTLKITEYDDEWIYTYHGYGTSDTGISNVVDTETEEAINPSTLEENTDLSDALQALIVASETVTISATFLK